MQRHPLRVLAWSLLIAIPLTAQEPAPLPPPQPAPARPAALASAKQQDLTVRVEVAETGKKVDREGGGFAWPEHRPRWQVGDAPFATEAELRAFAKKIVGTRTLWVPSASKPGQMEFPPVPIRCGAGVRYDDVVATIDALAVGGVERFDLVPDEKNEATPVVLWLETVTGAGAKADAAKGGAPVDGTAKGGAAGAAVRETMPVDLPASRFGLVDSLPAGVPVVEMEQTGCLRAGGRALADVAALVEHLRGAHAAAAAAEPDAGPRVVLRIDRWTEWARVEPVLRAVLDPELAYRGVVLCVAVKR